MGRTPGAKNKTKTQFDITVERENISNEDIFLTELVAGKARWAKTARDLKEQGKDDSKELEYSNAYKLLISQFTK